MSLALKNFCVGFIACACALVAPAFAQELPQPGAEHKLLAELAGEWSTKINVAGEEWTGTATYKMVHGGLWLASELDAKMPQGPFTGQGLDTYNPNKKKYVSVWVDSMAVEPLILEGEISKDGKTQTMTGKGPGMDGTLTDYKTVTEYVSKDKHTFKLWMGQTTGEPMMTAVYERKK